MSKRSDGFRPAGVLSEPRLSKQEGKDLYRKAHPEHTEFVRKILGEKLLIARREEVRKALQATGSVPAAAKVLGIGERTLWTWLQKDPEARKGLQLPASRVAGVSKKI